MKFKKPKVSKWFASIFMLTIWFLFTNRDKAIAQTSNTWKLSLRQTVELAMKNRYDVQSQQLNISIADNSTQKKTKEWLPDISATGNIRYNTQLQQNVLPSGVSGSSGEQRIAFGTKNQTSLSLDLNQTIYKPGLTDDIKIAKKNTELEQEKNREKQSDIKTEVTEAYLNVVLKELQLKIAQEDEARYSAYFLLAQGKYSKQVLLESDYLSAKLDLENAKVETMNARQNYHLSTQNLKYKINIPITDSIILTDNINNVILDDLPSTSETGVDNHSELKQLRIQQDENKLKESKYTKSMLPTLSLVGNYTSQFQYNNFNYLGNTWNPYNYVGLRLSIPITESYKNVNTIKEYRFKKTQYDLDIKQKTTELNYKVVKAQTELENAYHNIQSTRKSYEFSKQVYEQQEKEFKLGTLLYSSLLEKEKSIQTAELNYITAVYTYFVAKLNYETAIGASLEN